VAKAADAAVEAAEAKSNAILGGAAAVAHNLDVDRRPTRSNGMTPRPIGR
jgi:hypothetical protein